MKLRYALFLSKANIKGNKKSNAVIYSADVFACDSLYGYILFYGGYRIGN